MMRSQRWFSGNGSAMHIVDRSTSHSCGAARATFRGMRWIAWMTSALPFLCGAQPVITGHVVDDRSGAPIAYVSVGSIPVGAFTMTGLDGAFQLILPDSIGADSARFVMLGYTEVTYALGAIRQMDTVRLRPMSYDLREAEVLGEKRVERKLGNRSHHALFNYALVERRPGDVIEVGQVIELGPVPVRLQALNFFISDTPMDSATLRIGFRSFDGERPTGVLLDRSIVRRVALPDGWLSLDLRQEGIRLQGTIVATLELLPEPGSGRRWMAVGIRLGGGKPAFDRRGPFEEWARVPHRYSLNVTALVPKHAQDQEAEDPDPFQHAVDLRLPSRAVGDTFSIAFSLPKDYDPGRMGGYATVYVLDANVLFGEVVDLCRLGARKGYLPPILVVGVGYHNVGAMDTLRHRDYVASRVDSLPGSGGGRQFLSFLLEELVPLVDQRFSTDPRRTAILGHSLGGHAVLQALARAHPDDRHFSAYVAASPSVDVGSVGLMEALDAMTPGGGSDGPYVFMAHGEQEDDAAMRRCVDLVRQRTAGGLVEKHYPGTEHMGTAIPAFADGLRALWGLGK